MPLETFTDPDRISIKHLSHETVEKKPELRFDPKRDLTEEDWEGMVGFFESKSPFSSRHSELVTAGRAAEFFTIDRHRALTLFGPSDFRKLASYLSELRSKDRWWDFGYLAARLSIVAPSRARSLLTPEDWQQLVSFLDGDRKLSRWGHFRTRASHLATIDRDRALGCLGPEDMEEIFDIDFSRPQTNQFIGLASEIARIDPKRTAALLTPNDWTAMIAAFVQAKEEKEYGKLLSFAAGLTLLSKLEAEFGSPKSLPGESRPDLPMTRNF